MKTRKHFWSLLILLIAFTAHSGQDLVSIVVDGNGVSRDAAIQDAKRIAVEKGIGQIVASETIVKNYSLFSDQIISKSNGYVKSFEVLEEKQEMDNSWTVKIRADVTDIIDKVLQDQIAIDLLLQWVNKPRFMILIDEDIEGQEHSQVSEVEIGRLMSEKNFDVVSREQLQPSIKKLNLKDDSNIIRLAADNNVSILVMGTAHAEATEMGSIGYGNLGASGMKSGQASISAKVIRIETGEVLAQNTFTGASPHINPVIAGTAALKKASSKLAEYLITETIKTWSHEQANFQTFVVSVKNVSFSKVKEIQYLLETIDGVLRVRRGKFAGGTVDFQIDYQKGSIDNLAMEMDGYTGNGFHLLVIGATNYSLQLELKLD